ncbi:FtsX-like permease family protein [Spirosoma sp. HMF4905]|uniref:FtsX-like permease family protein n=1 Tax=Spirosoma arboris TaxID=2682092 RepID=A0A7K1SAC8_9BACT|nr:ABC transporter permease [Spirosoma arboris]MVM30793.1 FtsX-like permease family protein [Spirosoma arboris]
MLRNYAKIAIRSLLKNKFYSSINVFGLALGMACALLVGLWVHDELSYDRFLPGVENVYNVRVNYAFNGGPVETAMYTPGPLQEAIAQDIPGIAAVTKTTSGEPTLVKAISGSKDEKSTKEIGQYASANFFDVFELPALYGNPKVALAQLNQIIISRRLAENYFPNEVALGKTLQLDNQKNYTVGAVLENLPGNSTLQFDWLVNFKSYEEPWMREWGTNSVLIYARLKSGTTVAHTEALLKGIYPRYAKFNNHEAPILHPMADMHLYSEYKNGKVVGGQIEYVRIFSIVALFILLIACINFMNLATARSSVRAKEVGIRKVVGALRSSLVGQFLSESILTSLLAVVLALSFVHAILPTFNTLFDKQLALDLTNATLWLIITGLVLITGFLSGSYPALFLSALQPIKILKGRLQFGSGPAFFRRTLVVFQFSLSIFLIVGMLVVGKQMGYLRTKNLGLDRENVVYIPLEGDLARSEKTETYRQAALRNPSVASATITNRLPINVHSTSTDLNWPGKDPKRIVSVSAMTVGGDFIKTMNIKLLDGRDFRAGSLADSSNYLINEAAANLMGIKEPVGKDITFWRGKGQVVGLMKDFHLSSLHQAITPLVVVYNPTNTTYLLVKTHEGKTQQAITDLEQLSKQFNPTYPFTYHFMDEAYEKLYKTEQQISTLVNYFGMLAILISCLGLFALAAFTAEQRTKEIGVRKVLGASVASIVTLLSTDFLRLVLIALVLASPLAWWAVHTWLSTFAYQTELAWWIFGLAGVLSLGIAFLTVSYQSIKAALMNPVTSLRSE